MSFQGNVKLNDLHNIDFYFFIFLLIFNILNLEQFGEPCWVNKKKMKTVNDYSFNRQLIFNECLRNGPQCLMWIFQEHSFSVT